MGGAFGGAGGALGGVTPPGCPGGGGTIPEADTPGGGGSLLSFSPQLAQISASSGFTAPHFGHLFSFFSAVCGRKHILDTPLFIDCFRLKVIRVIK